MPSHPSKHWVFTLNNPPHPDSEYQNFFESNSSLFSYACFQREVGEAGTPHLQGYIEMKKRIRITGLKKLPYLATAHFEKRRGTRDEARAYCTKEDTRAPGHSFFETGSLPQAQGRRSDLREAIEYLQDGHLLSDVAKEYPSVYVKYHKGLSALCNATSSWRNDAPEVHLLYGDAGAGKTRYVYEHSSPDKLWVSPIGKAGWFDGYEGQEDVLIDDFAGRMSHTSLTDLLRILDRYTLFVPVKGGFTRFCPKRIFLTTNYLPSAWYDWTTRSPQRVALARRFSQLHVFSLHSDTVTYHRGDSPDPLRWDSNFYSFFLTQE